MSKFALIPDGTPQERIDHMAAVEALLRQRGAKYRVVVAGRYASYMVGVVINGSVQEQTDHLMAVLDLLDQRGSDTYWAVYNWRVCNVIKSQYPQRWTGWISNADQPIRVTP
jgi:tRNA isopentenyl-2-thiomethyl-A-37 hydroxylase MiaE